MNSRNSRAFIGLFSLSINGTDTILIYAMRQWARADNVTICYRKKEINVSFSCPVIDNKFLHNIVKVVCGSTGLSPRGSTATLTMLTRIGHRKEIRKMTFRALALRRSQSKRSKHQLSNLCTVANSHYQVLKPNYLIVILPPTQHHSFLRNVSIYTFTMLWRNAWSMTGQTHEKLTSIC